jgi:ribosomal-protein-alanine N-acetyltransferase
LRAELGYGLDLVFWGRGVMSAATAAAIEYAFTALGLHRIEAYVCTDNPRSAGVLEHCGFEREGTIRDRHFEQGAWRDYWVFGRVQR